MTSPWGALLPVACATLAAAAELSEIPGLTLTEVRIVSSADGTEQTIVVGVPESYDPGTPMPLLVGLHTWSADYLQRVQPYGTEAARRGWLVVLPNLRGPNTTNNPHPTQAGGSPLAQRDIVDARQYMIDHYAVDPDRIYLTGDSGGGHMTMLMAGKYPDLWTAAAAWVPITDLREWWEVQNGYAVHVEAVTGGRPGDSPEVDFEYLRRSPRTFMTNLAPLPVLLAHGDRDPTIPVEQTWRSFRALADLPAHHTLLHIFSGGHTSHTRFGLDWLAEHTRAAEAPTELHLVTDESKSYYWAGLTVAEPLTMGRADLMLGDDALSIAATGLSALTLDLAELPLPENGLTVSVLNDGPLALTMVGAPTGAEAVCEGDWARAAAGDGIALQVEPSAEARSLRLTW